MIRRQVCDLGVEEAYCLLAALNRFELPSIEAVEYEDWGRDWLLSRFLDLNTEELAKLGLEWDVPDEVAGFRNGPAL